jgi:hypothetical protein
MKTFYKIFILSGLLISVLFFGSCSKSENESQAKLEGKWKFINTANISDSTYVEDWEFTAEGKLLIYHKVNLRDPLVTYEGTYSMDSRKMFTVDGFTKFPLYNTKWEIISNEDNALMIVSSADAGLFYREFVKI